MEDEKEDVSSNWMTLKENRILEKEEAQVRTLWRARCGEAISLL
jgi:hypothetical protein